MNRTGEPRHPNVNLFRTSLLAWFTDHRRTLPWRQEPRDPYHVWIAECMLQQTQVNTVIPYYTHWLQRFPTLQSLAQASLDDVLKCWEGLGYYTRARNMHRTAQIIVEDFGGLLPESVRELIQLPGIGRYTAGAIASLAYGQDAAILDGNVKRVLTRVYALEGTLRDAATTAQLWELSEKLLPHGRAAEFNEALMDLGATVCTPRTPACIQCPLATQCIAYAKGHPQDYPRRSAIKSLPHKIIASAVIIDRSKRCLMAQRPTIGLLGGLWEFPGGEVNTEPQKERLSSEQQRMVCDQLIRIIRTTTSVKLKCGSAAYTGSVKHTFTHFRITRHLFVFRVSGRVLSTRSHYTQVRWMSPTDIDKVALTRSDRKILGFVSESLDRVEHG